MTKTDLLQIMEEEMGYKFTDLELDTKEILSIVENRSLYKFSKFYPYKLRYIINTETDRVPNFENRYFIKLPMYKILAVKRYFYNNQYGLQGDYIDSSGTFHSLMDAQLINDLISMVQVPSTFEFYSEDNSVEILPANGIKGKLLVELHVVHPINLSTIPSNMEDEFEELCVLDLRKALYPIRGRFANLQTPFGNIELFMQQLEEARDKREELLEKWRKNFYKSPKRKKIYVG